MALVIYPLQNIYSATSTVTNLQQNIADRNNKIKELDQQINQYQEQIQNLGQQKQTLSTALQTLDVSQKQIETRISSTQDKVLSAHDMIEKLSLQIQNTQDTIHDRKSGIAQSIRSIQLRDDTSLLEIVLARTSLASAWDDIVTLQNIQNGFRVQVNELTELHIILEEQKNNTVKNEHELLGLQSDLSDQKTTLVYNKNEKQSLLSQTKNKESNYNNLLKNSTAEREKFEQELFDFEAQLKIAIDTSKLPTTGHGVLSWPLGSVYVTQQFGKTSSSGRLYASGTHNGADFRAAIGTPVKAALGGIIWDTGNTDLERGCYSYGKWVLIKHPNGLSSIYGHLSVIKAVPGQKVTTGDIIGYSGATGYVTGPHLHLGVYATEGVRVEQYTRSINCKNVTIPIADIKAYLDPMAYLPVYK